MAVFPVLTLKIQFIIHRINNHRKLFGLLIFYISIKTLYCLKENKIGAMLSNKFKNNLIIFILCIQQGCCLSLINMQMYVY